jgi:ferrochelatase
VVWDLDNELRARAEECGVAFARAATPNADRRFARLAVDLIDELREGRAPSRCEPPQGAQPPPLYGASLNGELCTPDCGKP